MKNKKAPSYICLPENELRERIKKAQTHLTECRLCPHECGINRKREAGFCQASDKAVISSYGPHFGEEPALVGRNGSGTIFFAYCNMRCVFCQNYELSFGGEGEVISDAELADIMLTLQEEYRCHNINLVTPTHFVPNILASLALAKAKGLKLPLVYNCGGYERIETLLLLDGLVDIYMPDFKYTIQRKGEKYSAVKDYPERVRETLREMDRQVGGLQTDSEGIAWRGLLIRHLVMPGGTDDTRGVLKFISEELSSDCMVNLMEQYYPAHRAIEYKELSRALTPEEYNKALNYARELGLRLVF